MGDSDQIFADAKYKYIKDVPFFTPSFYNKQQEFPLVMQ